MRNPVRSGVQKMRTCVYLDFAQRKATLSLNLSILNEL